MYTLSGAPYRSICESFHGNRHLIRLVLLREFQFSGEKTGTEKESGVKKSGREPLFTMKALVVGAVLFSIYGVILFSMDPAWVAWAGPMALGGALYVPDPPPALFSAPQEVFQVASLFSLFSLFTLGLLIVLRGEPRLGWLSWLKAVLINGRRKGLAKAQEDPGTRGVLDASEAYLLFRQGSGDDSSNPEAR